MKNIVYIATSLDGFIADRNGEIEWLTSIPPVPETFAGFTALLDSVDAVLMGRNTFETVLGFEMEWVYSKPVYVWTSKSLEIPEVLKDKVFLVHGEVNAVVEYLKNQNIKNLYVDGGRTIQSFIQYDLVHELIITLVPVVLGGGSRLFGETSEHLQFKLNNVLKFDNQLVQLHYLRE